MEADNAHIRIGHAERDATVEQLREAAGDGRLTLDELDERIGVAMAARTRADLRPVLIDLLPPSDVEITVNPHAVVARAGEPGWSWQDPLVLTARWDDVVRAGPWAVPPFLEIHSGAGNVKLNFIDARVSVDRIDLVIDGGAGDVILIVDEGWGVDLSRLDPGMGGLKTSVAPTAGEGRPTIMVRGRSRLGTVKARHPNRFDQWQRRRRLARGGGIHAKN
ncbi:MAG: DUF1707 domain-containing protein [Propioniciclava sp.]